MVIYRLLFICFLFYCFPCQALIAGEKDNDSPERRIDSNSCHSSWAGVVSIQINSAVYSGVIIGKSWILTAAHVVESSLKAPENVHIYVPCQNIKLHVSKIIINHEYHRNSMQGIALFDVALLRLTSPLPNTIIRYPVNFQAISEGVIASFVGYGATGNACDSHLQPASTSIKHWGQNALDTVLVDERNIQQAYIYDFDGPNKSSNYLGGLTLGNQTETEVAPGDSGSPIFIKNTNNQWVVTGINTFRMSFPSEELNRAPPPPCFGSGGGGILLESVASWLLYLVPDLQVD